ncbi:hypothetical protein [Virgisporangium aurantiacum]|uniref:Uncharacterized protein n=1 Tax=Virgisporangium aurantiacum TaxID=175570 RepID=A0A8J3ZC42_9ACTN|nr:hypothetical protein [Virgisporangium aurantiacum]GIJ58926.1 hypothetical protein Vau01_064420 [Virgisporangium aurantiacum]
MTPAILEMLGSIIPIVSGLLGVGAFAKARRDAEKRVEHQLVSASNIADEVEEQSDIAAELVSVDEADSQDLADRLIKSNRVVLDELIELKGELAQRQRKNQREQLLFCVSGALLSVPIGVLVNHYS